MAVSYSIQVPRLSIGDADLLLFSLWIPITIDGTPVGPGWIRGLLLVWSNMAKEWGHSVQTLLPDTHPVDFCRKVIRK